LRPRFVVNIQRRLLTKTPHFAKTFIQKKMFQQQSFYTFNGKKLCQLYLKKRLLLESVYAKNKETITT
jgi:hypothetical protein